MHHFFFECTQLLTDQQSRGQRNSEWG